MKVLVTGSRKWTNAHAVECALRFVGATVVVHGDHWSGADLHAKFAAQALGIEQRPYKAQWQAQGRAAGPLRNQRMLDVEHTAAEPIAMVLAFPLPDSKGTWDMCARADKAGVPVRVLGDQGFRRRDTPENRAFWKSVADAADEWAAIQPAWSRKQAEAEGRAPLVAGGQTNVPGAGEQK